MAKRLAREVEKIATVTGQDNDARLKVQSQLLMSLEDEVKLTLGRRMYRL